MVAPLEHRQRIARLMPLDDVMRWIAERVHPVTPREMRAAAALGATLAQDIVVAELHPAAPLALIDGWAVHAESTADAGPYAPAVLPQLREVAVGQPLYDDSDAMAPLEAETWRGGNGEVHVAVTPGEGVLMPGTDAGVGEVLRQTGHRLRAVDVAAMQALGIAGARVRKPRIRVARAGRGRNDIADAIADWLAYAIVRRPFRSKALSQQTEHRLWASSGPLYCDELPIGSQFPAVRKPDQFARINAQGARNLTQNGYAC